MIDKLATRMTIQQQQRRLRRQRQQQLHHSFVVLPTRRAALRGRGLSLGSIQNAFGDPVLVIKDIAQTPRTEYHI
jgi:hypothetical protein